MSVTSNVEHEDTVVVYSHDNGHIVLLHQFITLSGGQHPDQKAREKEALDFASKQKNNTATNLAVLHTKPSSFKENTAYKVDTVKRVLLQA
jgi:hypothetical protein